MNRSVKRWVMTWVAMVSFFLGGCLPMNHFTGEPSEHTAKENDSQAADPRQTYEKENYIPIQEYTGEGYTLRDSREETGQMAEAHRDEVVKAVKQFFQDQYQTEVKIHNIVSAIDGVSVYVESVGEPHFYTFAIVPVDIENEEVRTDLVWSQEGQVENAIEGGLYAMAFEKEFAKLDAYLESVAKEYPVVGTRIEAIENVMGTGYSTEYYFISIFGDVFDDLLNTYLQNPDISKEEIRGFLLERGFKPEDIAIGVEFYMEKARAEPDQAILDKVAADIFKMQGLPKGAYSIKLNDNYIDRRHGIGKKKNTLEVNYPNKIIKE